MKWQVVFCFLAITGLARAQKNWDYDKETIAAKKIKSIKIYDCELLDEGADTLMIPIEEL
jgi:hypothetical protein